MAKHNDFQTGRTARRLGVKRLTPHELADLAPFSPPVDDFLPNVAIRTPRQESRIRPARFFGA